MGGAILEGVNPGGGFQEQGLRKPGNLEKETCHQKYWKRPRRMYPRLGFGGFDTRRLECHFGGVWALRGQGFIRETFGAIWRHCSPRIEYARGVVCYAMI